MSAETRYLYPNWQLDRVGPEIIRAVGSDVRELVPSLGGVAGPDWTHGALTRAVALLYDLNLVDLDGRSRPLDVYVQDRQRRGALAQGRVRLEQALARLALRGMDLPVVGADGELTYEDVLGFIEAQGDSSYCDWFAEQARVRDAVALVQQYGATIVFFTMMLSLLAARAPQNGAIAIYENLADEIGLGQGDGPEDGHGQGVDLSRFHPNVFRRLYERFGLEPAHRGRFERDLYPQTRYYTGLMLTATRLGYLEGAGALFCLEHSIPPQFLRIAAGLRRLGLSDWEVEFFDMHATLDVDHAERWWADAIAPFIDGPEAARAVLRGIALGTSARNAFWQGLALHGSAPVAAAGMRLSLDPREAA